MLNRKKILVAASIAGIMAASSSTLAMAGSAFPGHDSGNKSCGGMNGCKGVAGCKSGKNSCSGKHACSGKNSCSGQGTATKVEDGKLTG